MASRSPGSARPAGPGRSGVRMTIKTGEGEEKHPSVCRSTAGQDCGNALRPPCYSSSMVPLNARLLAALPIAAVRLPFPEPTLLPHIQLRPRAHKTHPPRCSQATAPPDPPSAAAAPPPPRSQDPQEHYNCKQKYVRRPPAALQSSQGAAGPSLSSSLPATAPRPLHVTPSRPRGTPSRATASCRRTHAVHECKGGKEVTKVNSTEKAPRVAVKV